MAGECTDVYHLLREAAQSFDMGMSALVMSSPNQSSTMYGLTKEAAAFVSGSSSQFFKKVLFLRGAPTIILDTRKSNLAEDPCVIGGPCLGCYMEATIKDEDGRIIGALILADMRARDGFSEESCRRFQDHSRRIQIYVQALKEAMERTDEIERHCQKACNRFVFLRDHVGRVPDCCDVRYGQAANQNSTKVSLDPCYQQVDRLQESAGGWWKTIPPVVGRTDTLSTACSDAERSSGLTAIRH
eukprot:TRINITY_DN9125_c0_g2_i2.p1 TRINITY_DN9125_c0_g2~~TRINITY_DN9125_c0_g2_i2.p1  ORF type:complete len:243 (+),score=39.71 TRINITY_DN9125_c0_g2_i2:56-784(+)